MLIQFSSIQFNLPDSHEIIINGRAEVVSGEELVALPSHDNKIPQQLFGW